jgi:hypothetical protein
MKMLKKLLLASAMALAVIGTASADSTTTCYNDGYYVYCNTTDDYLERQELQRMQRELDNENNPQGRYAQLQEDIFWCKRRKQKWLDQCTIALLRIGCPVHNEFNRPSNMPKFTPKC